MSNETEALLGLPDLSGLKDLMATFREVQAFVEELKAFYAAHAAEIQAGIEFVKEAVAMLRKVIEFIRGVFSQPATGGGLVVN